ncbi:MAG: hypothetical protein K6E18_01660 [Lachnospiraceae bacterium]|nr:hypothetical protein [Lachnospiraceae bacterium]
MSRKNKGEFGYLSYKKKTETIKTILYFLIPLSLFLAGILTTGTKKNLLTIVAVLGILPASKNAVLLIMYLKSKGITVSLHDKIESALSAMRSDGRDEVTAHLDVLYEMVFTTHDVTFEVPALFLYAGSICGFLQTGKVPKGKDTQTLLSDLEKHLETSLKKEGVTVNAKMFETEDAFLRRFNELKPLERAAEAQNGAACRILKQITL